MRAPWRRRHDEEVDLCEHPVVRGAKAWPLVLRLGVERAKVLASQVVTDNHCDLDCGGKVVPTLAQTLAPLQGKIGGGAAFPVVTIPERVEGGCQTLRHAGVGKP